MSNETDASSGVQKKEQGVDAHNVKDDLEVFSWHDVGVTVNSDLKILQHASGYAKAGEMIALMGPSGSGKTTLLNVLANRTATSNASVSGTIRANSLPISPKQLRSLSSYVEQEDALIGSLTVRETIDFAARLSVPGITSKQRGDRVNHLISAFGLDGQRDQKIGTPIQKGISGGQKRRVGVASQLVTGPRMLFLDEPTSGLDSFAAYEVMSLLKRIAESERMIIITSIHQPSTITFNLFDRLVLLSRGKTVYSGPTNVKLTSYFSSINRAFPMQENPAEFLLELTNTDFVVARKGEDAEAVLAELHSKWMEGDESRELSADIERYSGGKSSPAGSVKGGTAKPQRVGALSQTFILLHRNVLKSYRDILAYQIRLAMYIGLAIMMGTVWLRFDNHQDKIQPIMNAIFFSGAFMSFMAVAYIPSYLEDLFMYTKERGNRLYGPGVFLVANFLIGIPFIFLIAVIFSVITYWLVNFHHGAIPFFRYLCFLFLDLLAAESLVILISSVLPIFVAALAITAFANGLWMCVNGFLVSQKVLNVFWYYTFYWIDYQRYVFQSMMWSEFEGKVFECDKLAGGGCQCMYASDLQDQCQIDGSGVLAAVGYTRRRYGLWVGILLVVTFAMRFGTWLILRLRKA